MRAGEIVISPPDTPHRFVNAGAGTLRQLDIHLSPRFVTEWLTTEPVSPRSGQGDGGLPPPP